MNKLTQSLILAGIVAMPMAAMADDTAAPASPPSDFSITGGIDVGYTNLNGTGLFIGGVAPARVFDAPSPSTTKNFSGLNLNQANVTIAKTPKEGLGGTINLTAGKDAYVISSYGAGNKTATSTAANGANPYVSNSAFDVTQAYVSYVTGPATVILGKFATLAGAEVIASSGDTNYSRSILFGYAIPFTHTGARLTYAVSDTFSLIAGVNQGWDQFKDMNSDKTIELGFTAAPSKMFSFTGAFYGGKELANPGAMAAGNAYSAAAVPALSSVSNGNRQLIDLTATINATDSLSFVANYDNGSQANAILSSGLLGTGKWDGLALYANYQVNDQWRASLRTEYMNDKNGVRLPFVGTSGQTWKESTLTVAYMPVKSFEFRGEIRKDTSNQAVFLQTNGLGKTSQNSFGLEALYKF